MRKTPSEQRGSKGKMERINAAGTIKKRQAAKRGGKAMKTASQGKRESSSHGKKQNGGKINKD